MLWTVETLNAAVDAEIAALPADMQARYLRFVDIIQQAGFRGLPREAVKHLEDKLWELRITDVMEFHGRSMWRQRTPGRGDQSLHQEDAAHAGAGAENSSATGKGA
jgi:Gp49-like protein DUF891